jgi:hypothetical protein
MCTTKVGDMQKNALNMHNSGGGIAKFIAINVDKLLVFLDN